jgi:hypothetical protein
MKGICNFSKYTRIHSFKRIILFSKLELTNGLSGFIFPFFEIYVGFGT